MTILEAVYMCLLVPETNGVPLKDMVIVFESNGLAPQKMKAYKSYLQSRAEFEGVKEGGNVNKSIKKTRRTMTRSQLVRIELRAREPTPMSSR